MSAVPPPLGDRAQRIRTTVPCPPGHVIGQQADLVPRTGTSGRPRSRAGPRAMRGAPAAAWQQSGSASAAWPSSPWPAPERTWPAWSASMAAWPPRRFGATRAFLTDLFAA